MAPRMQEVSSVWGPISIRNSYVEMSIVELASIARLRGHRVFQTRAHCRTTAAQRAQLPVLAW